MNKYINILMFVTLLVTSLATKAETSLTKREATMKFDASIIDWIIVKFT